jgi:hypothetical protein
MAFPNFSPYTPMKSDWSPARYRCCSSRSGFVPVPGDSNYYFKDQVASEEVMIVQGTGNNLPAKSFLNLAFDNPTNFVMFKQVWSGWRQQNFHRPQRFRRRHFSNKRSLFHTRDESGRFAVRNIRLQAAPNLWPYGSSESTLSLFSDFEILT